MNDSIYSFISNAVGPDGFLPEGSNLMKRIRRLSRIFRILKSAMPAVNLPLHNQDFVILSVSAYFY